MHALESAPDLDSAKSAWSDFLEQHYRVFEKLRAATRDTAHAGWFGEITHDRKSDALLSYVHHARNADSHGISEVTQEQAEASSIGHVLKGGETGVVIAARPPNQSYSSEFRVQNMVIYNGRVVRAEVESLDGKPVAMDYRPERLILIPVVDRGVKYRPPTKHFDSEIADVTVIDVARLAFEYAERRVTEAEARAKG